MKMRSWRPSAMALGSFAMALTACGSPAATPAATTAATRATAPTSIDGGIDTTIAVAIEYPRTVRIEYGPAPEQFADLTVPGTDAPPVVVLIHGGFWRNPYDLTLMEPLADDLVARGFAVWNLEYRRLGDTGGGWPGTLTDVAAGVDALVGAADDHDLDLGRVAIVGHSAGGHLALWAAGRTNLADNAPGGSPAVVPVIAVGLGAVVDLVGAADAPLGNGAVIELLGGAPDDVPTRYEAARPRLDAGPRMVSVVGTDDHIVPPAYSVDPDRPTALELIEVEGADHFDLIDPTHDAWAAVANVLAVLDR